MLVGGAGDVKLTKVRAPHPHPRSPSLNNGRRTQPVAARSSPFPSHHPSPRPRVPASLRHSTPHPPTLTITTLTTLTITTTLTTITTTLTTLTTTLTTLTTTTTTAGW